MNGLGEHIMLKALSKIGMEIFKTISSIRPHPINGTYCTCWQCDPGDATKHEVGSMRIYKLGKKVKGFIICADAVWPINATYFDMNEFDGYYMERPGSIARFSLAADANGLDIDRFLGTWEGTVMKDLPPYQQGG